ncbi:MAG: hypothetical protein ABIR06_20535 [Cyclobacteriaceae bacterium]
MKKQEATLVQRACAKVAGFKALHKRLEKKNLSDHWRIIVSGKSIRTLNNYMRCISHVALYFKCLPSQLDIEQIEEYLLSVKKRIPLLRNHSLSIPFMACAFCFGQRAAMIALSGYPRSNGITNYR